MASKLRVWMSDVSCRGAVAQSIERPSNVPCHGAALLFEANFKQVFFIEMESQKLFDNHLAIAFRSAVP